MVILNSFKKKNILNNEKQNIKKIFFLRNWINFSCNRLSILYCRINKYCQTINFSNNISLLFLITFSLGIFFINRYHSHDWGDDFALYLMQAENLASLKFQIPTYYVFNPLNPIIAPAYYPPIFPVFLSLFFPFIKTDINSYILLIHCLMISNIIVFWQYAKKNHARLYVFLLCLLWLYNPWVLGFKNEVMSEFLFVFLLILFFYNFSKKDNFFFSIVFGSLMVATRTVGIVIIPTLLILSIFDKRWKYNSLLAIGIVVLSLIYNYIFTGYVFDVTYALNFQSDSVWLTILSNSEFYFKHLYNIFIPFLETKNYLIVFTQFSTIGLLIIGFYSVFKEKKHLPESLFLIFYLGLIFTYPYQAAGYRFLFPIFPLLLLIIAQSIAFINRKIELQGIKKMTLIIPVFFLIQYLPSINYVVDNQREPDGPYSNSAQEAWLAIKQNTLNSDTIYFNYPKALGFMTGRYSCVYPNNQLGRINYFLDDSKNQSKYVNHLINGGEYFKTWENHRFALYARVE